MSVIYVYAFVIGGALCFIGQLLIDLTKLTPARILVCYVCAGVALGALGIYEPLIKVSGEGARVPLTGFGYLLCKGVEKQVDKDGLIGILSGGLTACAAGVAAAMIFAFLAALIFKPKQK